MDSIIRPSPGREERFRLLYEAAYSDLLRFVSRRVHTNHAEDVVGEVMLVAWRRFDDVPEELSAARAWLFGVARHTLLNARRKDATHEAIAVRLGEARLDPTDVQMADLVARRADITAAWPRLSAAHQEAMALAVFDELSAPEAAAVLGITATAFRLRLSRARRSLRHHIESAADDPLPGHLTTERTPR